VFSDRFSVLRGHHQELGVVEPFWEAQLAVLVTMLVYVALPSQLTVGLRWLVPALEGVLLLGLAVSTPSRHHTQAPIRRRVSIGLIAIVTAANFGRGPAGALPAQGRWRRWPLAGPIGRPDLVC
jgi:hypothetical protein